MYGAFDIAKQKNVCVFCHKEDLISYMANKHPEKEYRLTKQSTNCFWKFLDTGELIPVEKASSSYSELKPFAANANSRSLVM